MSELAPPAHPAVRRVQRLEAVRAREQQISRLMVEQRLDLEALATEDLAGLGARYVADELALLWRRSPRQARNRLDSARAFAAFPAVHALVGDGTWLIDHADAAVDELIRTGLTHDEQRQVLELVLSRRVTLTPWEVRAAVRTAAVVLYPDAAAEAAERAQTDRDVRMYADRPGEATLLAYGPAPAVAAMLASLDALTFPPAPEETRTVAQRRFDTLYDLVCGKAHPEQWQVQVLVGAATVRGEDEAPAEVVGLGAIPAAQARELAAGGTLRRVVVADRTGRLLAVDDRVHRPDHAPSEVAAVRRPAQVAEQQEPVEPDPDAPSAEDLAWYDGQLDRDALYAHLQQPTDSAGDAPASGRGAPVHLVWSWSPEALRAALGRMDTEPGGPDEAARTGPVHLLQSWSPEALGTVLRRMSTAPVRHLDLHTDAYAVPARLKRHLVLRDRTCVFPGCPRTALRCDKDHLIPWPRGSTSEANLADECEHHHQGKHDCLTVQRLPDGTFRWTTPSGLSADRPPRPVLDAWTYRV
jgi:voltage-gated potassium channel Kch